MHSAQSLFEDKGVSYIKCIAVEKEHAKYITNVVFLEGRTMKIDSFHKSFNVL